MPAGLRKAALTVHVLASVGWAGAAAAFLALAVTGLASGQAAVVPAVYVAADVVATKVIAPLALAAVATGVVQSLGTPWGLLRHWWVIAKLVVSSAATLLLLLHLQPVGQVADAAAAGDLGAGDLQGLRAQLVVQGVLALAALLGTTALSVVKPSGRTRYGRRVRPPSAPVTAPG